MELKPGYKLTEVGVLPEDWEVISLGKLANITRLAGAEYSSVWKETPNGEIIALRGFNIGKNRIIERDFVRISNSLSLKLKRSRLYKDDVIYPCVGTIGNAVVIDEDDKYHIQQNIAKITPDKNILSPHYLAAYLMSFYGGAEIERFNATSSQPNVLVGSLRQYRVPLPSQLAEQRLISTALFDMDELLGALNRLIAKKRDFKQTAMQQLLTGKKRLPGFGEGKGYQQTEIGTIPEDWDYLPIGHFITEFRGGAPLKPSDFTQSGVKVLPKGGVVRGGLLTIAKQDLQFCSREYADRYNKNQVDESYTIVVLRDLVPSGPSIGLIVRIGQPEKYVLAQGVYGFKVREGVTPEYLIQYSNSFPYRRLMNEIMVGSTQVHITNTAFQEAKLPFPSIEEQREIATVLSDMDAEIATLEQRRDKTRALKQGMMQELLTGRIRLV